MTARRSGSKCTTGTNAEAEILPGAKMIVNSLLGVPAGHVPWEMKDMAVRATGVGA